MPKYDVVNGRKHCMKKDIGSRRSNENRISNDLNENDDKLAVGHLDYPFK